MYPSKTAKSSLFFHKFSKSRVTTVPRVRSEFKILSGHHRKSSIESDSLTNFSCDLTKSQKSALGLRLHMQRVAGTEKPMATQHLSCRAPSEFTASQ